MEIPLECLHARFPAAAPRGTTHEAESCRQSHSTLTWRRWVQSVVVHECLRDNAANLTKKLWVSLPFNMLYPVRSKSNKKRQSGTQTRTIQTAT